MSAEPQHIPGIIEEYEGDARAIEEQLVQISWYMRGWSMDEMYNSTYSVRRAALKQIEDNIERVKTSGLALL